jgi:hypothetical protein
VERETAAHRRTLARGLYLAGSWNEARRMFAELTETPPDTLRDIAFHHGHLQGHLDEGYLAVIAERTGDQAAADRWCRTLEEMDRPFLFGSQWLWLAAVAAVRNEQDRAVTLLRRAFAGGLPREMCLHTEPHLTLLRGYEPFDTLLEPGS